MFIRLYAWFYLLQTWCPVRFDDHTWLEPGLLRNFETSLTGGLTRSKTHGPDKRIQRKPVFLDKSCWFALKNWCVSWQLCVCWTLRSLATTTSLRRGLPLVVHGVHTCCAALGVAKAERNVPGRWAQNQSDTYVRLQRTLVQKVQLLVVSVIRGRDDIGSVLGKGESLQELESFLEKGGVDRETIKKQLTRLDMTASPGPAPPQATVTQPLQAQVEALEEEMLQLGPCQEEEVDVVVRKHTKRQACANIKESRAQALNELPHGFYVCEAGRSKAKRLHPRQFLHAGLSSNGFSVQTQYVILAGWCSIWLVLAWVGDHLCVCIRGSLQGWTAAGISTCDGPQGLNVP